MFTISCSYYINTIDKYIVSKKKKHSDAGKGDKDRVSDKKKYDENWEKIFGNKKKRKKK